MTPTLGQRQAALMAALAGAAPVPAGFDASRVRAAAAALVSKRARCVAQAWPSLRIALGERFQQVFAAYASVTPLPAQGGPLADGRCFVRHLGAAHALPDAVLQQALLVDAGHVASPDGLARRRWPCLRIGWLPQSRRLLVALGGPRATRLWRIGLATRRRY
jgi:hypothetical protein